MSSLFSLIAGILSKLFNRAKPSNLPGAAASSDAAEDPINGISNSTPSGTFSAPSAPQTLPNLEQALSPHFRLSELVVSNSGARAGLDNTPSPGVIANLKRLAATLELIRSYLFNVAIIISSGYRSDLINALIGGAPNSAHKQGLAVDFIAPGYGRPIAIAKAIAASGIVFDQLILEGTWVHLALPPLGQAPRMQVLTAVFQAGHPTIYLKGIVE